MKCRSLLLILALLPVVALGQVTAGSNSQSTAGAQVTTAPVQSLTVEAAPYPTATTSTIRNSPQVFAPAMQPTTPCTSVMSGGMSVVGFGLSLGGSYEDKECTRREFARVLAQMGYPDAGLAVLCRNEEVSLAAPQLCKRSEYVATRPEDYVGSERPVMPPAPVQPRKDAPVPSLQPMAGTVGYGPMGNQFRYNGTSWVAEDAWQRQQQQQQQAAEKALMPRPEVLIKKE